MQIFVNFKALLAYERIFQHFAKPESGNYQHTWSCWKFTDHCADAQARAQDGSRHSERDCELAKLGCL